MMIYLLSISLYLFSVMLDTKIHAVYVSMYYVYMGCDGAVDRSSC